MRWLKLAVVALIVPCAVNAYEWTACIDPGHGQGTGTSCEDESFYEDDLSLEIGLRLYDLLTEEFGEGNVSITRISPDEKPGLSVRAQIGQGLQPDAYGNWVRGDTTKGTSHVDEFLSIHFDTWDSQLNGTQVYVYASGGYGRDNPKLDPAIDSSYAMSRDIVNCFVLVTGSRFRGDMCAWDRASARENGQEWPLPPDGYEPPNDGIMGRSDIDVLKDSGWDGADEWKARCLLECEYMNSYFCNYLQVCKDWYTELAAEGIYHGLVLYRQKADPGGMRRVVHIAGGGEKR